MSLTDFSNVNFKILLKMHNGDVGRAEAAWKKICQIGRYGDVPASYEGGLDVKGLRIALEERESGQAEYEMRTMAAGKGPQPACMSETLADDIKRIEDLAAGDRPE